MTVSLASFFAVLVLGRLSSASGVKEIAFSGGTNSNGGYLEGPVIIKEPMDIVDFSNTTGVRLECKAKGNPEPSITWLSSEGLPVGSIAGLRVLTPEGTIVLLPFKAEEFRQDIHAVAYRCSASNSVGTVVGKDIHVKAVISQPYEVYVYDTYVIHGNDAVLHCHVPTFLENYVVVVSWIKNNHYIIDDFEINEEDKYMVLPNGDLYIRSVDSKDHGSVFKCKTFNSLTNTTKISQTEGRLFMTNPQTNIPPRIIKPKTEIALLEGSPLLVPCIAQGHPVPHTQWFKKTSKSLNSLKLQGISPALSFKSVSASDNGSYVCMANNSFGQDSIEVSINVKGSFVVEVSPRKIIADVGNSAEIVCKVNGNPLSVVNWFHNGRVISTGKEFIVSRNSLTIPKISSYFKGMYQCMAKQDKLTSYDSLELKLGDTPPELLYGFNETILHPGDTLSISCAVSGSPIPSIKWFLYDTLINTNNEVIIQNGNVISWLNVTNVSSKDGGVYTCKATNKVGVLQFFRRINIVGPLFLRDDVTLTAVAGNNVELFCPVGGYPIESIIWKRGRKILPYEERQKLWQNGTLSIYNVQKILDNGTYECTAKDSFGKAGKGNIQLKVLVPPKITPFSFQEDLVREGMRARIHCVVSEGDLPLLIQWTKDGQPIPSNDGVTIRDLDDYSSILSISSVTPRHNGHYTCTASNEAASTSHTTRLFVNVPPKIIAFSFQDDQFFKGMRAHIICAVSQGDLPISFTWLKDGKPISPSLGVVTRDIDGHANSLSIESVSSIHTGNYTCIASNEAAQVAHLAQLLVYVAPKITPFWFQEVNRIEGSFARVTCLVYQGDLPITLQWLKNGQEIPENMDISIRKIDEYSSILTIESVQSKHAGNYTCLASNAAASVSYTTPLVVNVPPKIVPFNFEEDHLQEGMIVRVSCVVSRGDLPLTISWLKDNLPIPSHLSVSVRDFDEYSSVLSIDPVTLQHSGNYSCVARNHAGTASHTASLTVYVPPRWIISPKDTETIKGTSVIINCQADGFPKPTITWKKVIGDLSTGDTMPIVSQKEIKVLSNGSLFFKSISESDEGFYFCSASNGIGIDRSLSMFLTVKAPVYFNSKTLTQKSKLNSLTVLSCEAYGEYPIEFLWKRNKMQLDKDNSKSRFNVVKTTKGAISNMSFDKIKKEDSGFYTCIAINSYGNATLQINLIVQELPSPPEITSIKNKGNRSVEISWNRPFDGNSRILKYSLQQKKKQDSWNARSSIVTLDSSETKVILKDLIPATVYEFRVAAENEVGLGNYSNTVSIIMEEEAPEGTPQQIEIETVEQQALRVSWRPPNKNTWNGMIRGYYIGYRVHESGESFIFNTLDVPEDYTEELIYQLSNLQMFTQYEIIVQAYNNGGRGPSSEPIVVMTSEDIPEKPPMDVRCSALSSHSIYVVWNAPPSDSINGILRGYKVIYKSLDKWSDPKVKVNVTSVSKIMLTGLDINANYSIQVLAFTKVGDGVRSNPIFCKTYEDVPGAPANIKALPVSDDSVLIAWQPPQRSNGAVTKYNVYYTVIGDGEEPKDFSGKALEGVNVQTVQNNLKTFEAKGLQKNTRYAFWVSAMSTIGEGPISTVITQTPVGKKVPARIASFDDVLKTHWKKDVEFPCRATGIPTPQRKWLQRGNLLLDNERYLIRFDGTLLIKKTIREDSGEYICEIRNDYGKDDVRYSLVVMVPPDVPVLEILSKTLNSARFHWKSNDDGGYPIQNYIFHYRKQTGQWEIKEFPADVHSYILDNLSCGATYQFYMEANNDVGTSKPSEIITVTTNSDVFQLPPKSALIQEGTTFITVHLDSWPSTSCPVQYFLIEYKQTSASEWTVVSRNIKPIQKKLVISNLHPATWYVLRLSAYTSEEEFNIGEYMFSTLTAAGGVVSHDVHLTDDKVVMFSLDPWIFIPIVLLVIICIVASVVVFIYCRKKTPKRETEETIDWSQFMGHLGGNPDGRMPDEYYGTIYKTRGRGTMHRHATLRRPVGNDPNLYATIRTNDGSSAMTIRRERSRHNPARQFIPNQTQSGAWMKPGGTNPFLYDCQGLSRGKDRNLTSTDYDGSYEAHGEFQQFEKKPQNSQETTFIFSKPPPVEGESSISGIFA